MKKIWIALGGVVAALIIALLAVPGAIDWNTYRARIAGAASDALGREVTIGGDLGVQLLPTPRFTARNVSIANLKGATDPAMMNLRLIEVQIALGPLFGGNVQVETVRLIEPDIRLEVLADGRRNWEFTPANAAQPATPPPAAAQDSPA
ncbi:MAG: AsmA family protein, partial [Proteobacteria bacterium]|nr:AsmA family protein [Pseudomonadota bacterium]